jgi:quinol monooxygenase YgiN
LASGDEVAWLFEVEVKPDRRGEFEALIPEMVASTRQEPGARAYQFFGQPNADALCVYERYADSEAAMAHMGIFGEKFAARFLDLATPTRFTVLGPASQALVDALTPIGAVVHSPIDGFVNP